MLFFTYLLGNKREFPLFSPFQEKKKEKKLLIKKIIYKNNTKIKPKENKMIKTVILTNDDMKVTTN